MDDIEHFSKRSRKRSDEKRQNDIEESRAQYLAQFKILSPELDGQEKQLKRIQKLFNQSNRPSLKSREIVQVKILSGISPKEVFVMKTSDEPHAKQFHSDIQRDYDTHDYECVFSLRAGVIGMAKTAENGWQRCRLVRLHTKCACTVFLLDIGQSEHIKWINFRLLSEKWCTQKPFAIRCALVDIESANPIDRYTPPQQQKFMQTLQMYKDFYISVNRPCATASDIFLYYVLDNRFHCVNEIFPCDLSMSSDDYDDRAEINRSQLSHSGTKVVGADAVAIIRSAHRPFTPTTSTLKIDQSAKQLAKPREQAAQSMANKMATVACNIVNEIKKKSAVTEAEPKDPSHRIETLKPLDHEHLTKPEGILRRHIDETGAIFVCFKKYKDILDSLRMDIQKHTKHGGNGIQSDDDELAWSVGDYCLVQGKFECCTEWLRGKITHISALTAANDDGVQLAHVYLRDVGKTVEVPLRSLKSIHLDSDGSIRNVRDFVWQTHLAHIEIIERESGQIAKILRKILGSYNELAISVLDFKGDQFDVILWGIQRKVHALLPEQIQLININEELVNQGYALALAKFDEVNVFVNNLMNLPPATTTTTITTRAAKQSNSSDNWHHSNSTHSLTYEVTNEQMDVTDWQPSEPILKREFVAIPMHLTQKLVLSILEANRYNVAEKIKDILDKKYKFRELEQRDATEWKPGDPCFARFSADGRFYRGTVRRVNLDKNFCMIKFVDYGNCSPCSYDDLRKATMFGNIPVLPRLYELDNIRPLTEDGQWSNEIRDFCADSVVDHQCNLIVTDPSPGVKSPDEPTSCKLEIFTKDHDLASALVSRGMAEWIRLPPK